MVPCLETGLALVWSVRMTSEDPIPLDQDPMQSWIGVAHSGELCTLANTRPVYCTLHCAIKPKNFRCIVQPAEENALKDILFCDTFLTSLVLAQPADNLFILPPHFNYTQCSQCSLLSFDFHHCHMLYGGTSNRPLALSMAVIFLHRCDRGFMSMMASLW